MDPRLKRQFAKLLKQQIRFFVLALGDIRSGADTRAVGGFWGDDRFWYGVQNALLAVGNTSKVLWGQKGKYATERAALREWLGITDDSPIRPTRMRNHFEHMDERIDKWYADGAELFSDRVVAGVPPYRSDTGQFRWFEGHETLVVNFWGDRWDLGEVTEEMLKIRFIVDDYPTEGWYPIE